MCAMKSPERLALEPLRIGQTAVLRDPTTSGLKHAMRNVQAVTGYGYRVLRRWREAGSEMVEVECRRKIRYALGSQARIHATLDALVPGGPALAIVEVRPASARSMICRYAKARNRAFECETVSRSALSVRRLA